jgi:hypothetical protein
MERIAIQPRDRFNAQRDNRRAARTILEQAAVERASLSDAAHGNRHLLIALALPIER